MPYAADIAGQQIIDKEIAEHEAAIYRLRQRRNALSAIHNVPIDVLSLIFTAYKTLTVCDERGAWLNIMSVCHYWRDIIYDTPEFWCSISSDDDAVVDEMLERSRARPLHLYYAIHETFVQEFWTRHWPTIQRVVPPHGERIASISFRAFTSFGRFFAELFYYMKTCPNGLPSLREVRLERILDRPGSMVEPYLSSDIPFNSMPSLNVLHLEQVYMNQFIPPVQSLTNLVVTTPDGISLNWIINVLQQLPNVEHVELGKVLRSPPHEIWAISKYHAPLSVPLPRLQYLDIRGQELTVGRLFRFMAVAGSARATVMLNLAPRIADTEVTRNLGYLKPLLSQLTSARTIGRVTTRMQNALKQCSLELYSPGQISPFLDLLIPFEIAELPKYTYTNWISASLSLSTVSDLTIQDDTAHDTSAVSWSNYLTSFTSLKTLTLVDISLNDIQVILCSSTSTLKTTELEVITLTSIHSPLLELPLLIDFLKKRREHGCPIHRLVIKKCSLQRELIDTLREHATVDWDGVEEVEAWDWWAHEPNFFHFYTSDLHLISSPVEDMPESP
ncbi:hypothetical protein ONZ45_g13135 [Pleurotus djamor]|nr:hypothetical protein ONZ45_g13135 [Pleurotus djamor]